ncbi:ATP-binding protein, partial [Brevibacillus laterosporus]
TKEYQSMSFEDRFSLLVDLEYSRRKSNSLNRLIKNASFSDSKACIEDIEYYKDRKLNKDLILKLASGVYIQNHHNIILKGPTGSGKTFMACGFGVSACRQFHKVKYIRLPEMLDELSLAKLVADGSYRRIIKKYTKTDVLILDEWLLTDLSKDEVNILLEVTEARHKTSSTIYCSQIDPSGWHLKLGNGPIAEAILDRIIHDSYQILLDGELSMRERHGLNSKV